MFVVQTFENIPILLKLSLFLNTHTAVDSFMSATAQLETV